MFNFKWLKKVTVIATVVLSACVNMNAREIQVGTFFYELNGDEAVLMRPVSLKERKYVIPEKITYSGLNFKVTAIGGYKAFAGASATEIVLPSTIKSIAAYAFQDCKRLKKFEIPASVTSLSWRVFYGCDKLESIVIPPSVEHIGWGAFTGCCNLKKVVCLSPKIKFGGHIFEDCSLLRSVIYASVDAPDNWTAVMHTYVPSKIGYDAPRFTIGKTEIIELLKWHRTTYLMGQQETADLSYTCNLKGYTAEIIGTCKLKPESGKWSEMIPVRFSDDTTSFIIQIPYYYTVIPRS